MMVSLANFTHLTTDFEALEYSIRADLKKARAAFNRNFLYPDLKNLCTLETRLNELLQYIPDKERQTILRGLLTRTEKLRQEGETILQFIRDQLRIQRVGPDHSTEFGCVVIGHRAAIETPPELHVFCYHRSQFDVNQQTNRRIIKLEPIRKVHYHTAPMQIRRNLMQEREPLSRLSTFYIESTDPFPLHRSICPAAVSRMLNRLSGYIH